MGHGDAGPGLLQAKCGQGHEPRQHEPGQGLLQARCSTRSMGQTFMDEGSFASVEEHVPVRSTSPSGARPLDPSEFHSESVPSQFRVSSESVPSQFRVNT